MVDVGGQTQSSELLDSLKSVFESPSYEPPLLPAAALELIELSRKSDVTIGEIVALVERDSFIAARVLRVAQSPRYTCSGGAPSLHHAAVRLGLDTMTNIFLEVATHMRVFRAPGYEAPMERLRRHSVATANIARVVCRYTSVYDEYAFLCGLFHDVGIAAAMIVVAEQRKKVPRDFALDWPTIRSVHAPASGLLCRLWKLPPDVGLATSHHHHVEVGRHVHPTSAVVAVAEVVASRLGYGFEDEVGEALPEVAMRAIGVDEKMLGLIEIDAKAKLVDID